jgi:hypothetical protein
MEKSAYYKEPRTYMVYDGSHIIGYLNEEIVEDYLPEEHQEDEQAYTAYKYTGTEADGGTVMPCDNPSDYGEVANAIIRSRYSVSQEMAIHRHAGNGDYEDNPKEYEDYNQWCEAAVALAKKWLGIS